MPEVFTPHLSLPLPHPSNSLCEDVLRIRDAFTVLDQKIAALDTLLSSDDFTLDSVMELVAAIKANRDSIQALVLNNATKDQLSAEVAARTLAISNEATARADAIAAEAQARAAALDQKQDRLVAATQAEMESGTDVAIRSMSPLRVKQAIAALAGSKLLRSVRTSNTALTTADNGKLIDITSGTFTQTFAACATLGNGWFCYLKNSGAGDITLDPNASETIDGLTSYIMYPGEVRLVQCDGTVLRSVVLNSFYKVFTASGTFTKPPGYLFFQGSLFGGGGSGGASAGSNYSRGYASGGSGGARVDFVIKAEALAAQETFVAGAGGAAKTASTAVVSSIHNMVGSPGGSSSFKNISAPGGVAGGVSESSVPQPVSNGGYKLTPLHPGIDEGTAAGANTYSSSTYFSPAGGGAEPPYSAGGISFLAGSGGDSAVDLYSNNATPAIAVSGKFPGGGGGAAVKRTVNAIDMPSATSGAGASGGLIIFGVI